MQISELHLKKFAVVRLWIGLQNAESENIARLKNAAKMLGIECIEITFDGYRLDTKDKITSKDVDFVIHLHFETPKAYDAFSFVALWNPLQFYLDWGYEKFSKHLLTHDDFLSCDSFAADDHIKRLIYKDNLHLPPSLPLFHTLSTPIIPPELKSRKLFYAGINWERLGKGKSRHQELLKELDASGLISIYGPQKFQGVNVWAGYKSYVKEIPFDGISMIYEISKVGAALVLSSEAHKQSALMSNRLFEALAAGALVICDENPFAKKYFGDTLLYIDTKKENLFEQIDQHMVWAEQNKQQALSLALSAQEIFKKNFLLHDFLLNIYSSLENRKKALSFGLDPTCRENPPVKIFYFLVEETPEQIDIFIKSFRCQDYVNIDILLIIDENCSVEKEIMKEVEKTYLNVSLFKVDKFKNKLFERFGMLLTTVIQSCIKENFEYFLVLTSEDEPFSNHVSSLVRILRNKPNSLIGATTTLLQHQDADTTYMDIKPKLMASTAVAMSDFSFANYIFSKSVLTDMTFLLLPYLNIKSLIGLVGEQSIATSSLATVIIKMQYPFYNRLTPNQNENLLINDLFPALISPAPLLYRSLNQNSLLEQIKIKIKKKKMPSWLRTILAKIYHYLKDFSFLQGKCSCKKNI